MQWCNRGGRGAEGGVTAGVFHSDNSYAREKTPLLNVDNKSLYLSGNKRTPLPPAVGCVVCGKKTILIYFDLMAQ